MDHRQYQDKTEMNNANLIDLQRAVTYLVCGNIPQLPK